MDLADYQFTELLIEEHNLRAKPKAKGTLVLEQTTATRVPPTHAASTIRISETLSRPKS